MNDTGLSIISAVRFGYAVIFLPSRIYKYLVALHVEESKKSQSAGKVAQYTEKRARIRRE